LAGIQDEDKSGVLLEILQQASDQGIAVHSYKTHQTDTGPGLGTDHFELIAAIKPLLVVGKGVRSYDAGEAWHLMDQRLGLPAVMVEMDRLDKIKLSDYTHLLLVDGVYKAIHKKLKKRIATWVNDGGVLLAIQGAATWAESLCFEADDCAEKQDEEEEETTEPSETMAYADFDDQKAQRSIGGAIVSALVDNTHPIAYGYGGEMPLFRRGTTLLKVSENPFTTAVRYTENPLLNGYIGTERLAEMSNQPAVIAQRHGKGLIVRFANDPLFRGFWRGTERLWVNALYFGPLVNSTELPQ